MGKIHNGMIMVYLKPFLGSILFIVTLSYEFFKMNNVLMAVVCILSYFRCHTSLYYFKWSKLKIDVLMFLNIFKLEC